jgi:hypothetical protein
MFDQFIFEMSTVPRVGDAVDGTSFLPATGLGEKLVTHVIWYCRGYPIDALVYLG